MPEDFSIQFEAYNPRVQTFVSNRDEFRVLLDTGRDQWKKIRDLNLLPNGVYEITIKPIRLED